MHRYVYAAFGGLMLGITWRSLCDTGLAFTAVCAFLIVVLLVLCVQHVVTREICIFTVVMLIFVAVGVMRVHSVAPTPFTDTRIGTEVSFVGHVVQEPDVRGTYTNLIVESESFTHAILVRVASYPPAAYRDTLRITGVLEVPKNFESEEGRTFNYRGYLAKSDVYYLLAFPDVEILAHATTPTGLLLNVKHTYLTTLKQLLPEPSAALAGGITVGERRSLGDELTQAFRDTGLIHIVVLSGYNIAIIVVFISVLLGFLPPRPRFTVAIIAIALFTVLVGASATVVRAALMGSIAAVGAMAHRTYSALHALVVAGFVMLLWNPYLLLFDPSFQLSFIATLGLLLGVPLLTPYLTFIPERFGMRELVAATVTTQIAVLPLLAYMIGEVSLVALVVNVLTLPVIPLAMLGVFLTGVIGMYSDVLAAPIALLSHWLLGYIIKVVELFAALPFATISLGNVSILAVLVWYLIYGLVFMYYVRKKNRRPERSA